jgi:signal transduction histidine kinase
MNEHTQERKPERPVAQDLVKQNLLKPSGVEPGAVEQSKVEQIMLERSRVEQKLARMKDFMNHPGDPLAGAGADFGEVLRHELNNPLTGILGNAELLLAEIHRGNDGRLPPGGLHRLETIAVLAVRLRETIRRLSQEWEVRDAALRKKTGA